MREILFKAKRIDNGEWVEGYYVYVNYLDKHCIVNRIKNPHGVDFIVQMTEHDVDVKTLCQYTGLTDKNGNKIWENDILFAKEPYIPTYPFSIKYNQETISYVGLYDGFGKEFELSKELLSCSEVIGNIFDSADLLKGE